MWSLRSCRYSSFMGIHFRDFFFNVRQYCYLFFAFTDQPSIKPARWVQGSVQWHSRCRRFRSAYFRRTDYVNKASDGRISFSNVSFRLRTYVFDRTRAVITSAGAPSIVRTWVGFSTTWRVETCFVCESWVARGGKSELCLCVQSREHSWQRGSSTVRVLPNVALNI
jgi:hypothetical protein